MFSRTYHGHRLRCIILQWILQGWNKGLEGLLIIIISTCAVVDFNEEAMNLKVLCALYLQHCHSSRATCCRMASTNSECNCYACISTLGKRLHGHSLIEGRCQISNTIREPVYASKHAQLHLHRRTPYMSHRVEWFTHYLHRKQIIG